MAELAAAGPAEAGVLELSPATTQRPPIQGASKLAAADQLQIVYTDLKYSVKVGLCLAGGGGR